MGLLCRVESILHSMYGYRKCEDCRGNKAYWERRLNLKASEKQVGDIEESVYGFAKQAGDGEERVHGVELGALSIGQTRGRDRGNGVSNMGEANVIRSGLVDNHKLRIGGKSNNWQTVPTITSESSARVRSLCPIGDWYKQSPRAGTPEVS